jgi:hypothetical protein
MIQPLVDFCQSQLAESDASKDCSVRAPNAIGVGKLARKTPRKQIQDTLIVSVEVFPVAQSCLLSLKSLLRKETPSLP